MKKVFCQKRKKKDNQYARVIWSRFSLSELWNWKLLLKKKNVVVDAMAENSWAFLFLLLFFLLYENIFLVQQDSPDQVFNYLIARLYHHLTIPLLKNLAGEAKKELCGLLRAYHCLPLQTLTLLLQMNPNQTNRETQTHWK